MFSWIKRRPKWVKAIAVAALLFLGWAGWTVWGVVWQQPNPSVDYIAEINELVRSSQPEGENSWPIYRDLIVNELGYDGVTNLGNAKWDALSSDEIGELVFGEWGDARHKERKAQLESMAPFLATLDEAADKPVFYMPLVYAGTALVPESTAGLRTTISAASRPGPSAVSHLARLNTAGMRAAVEEEDWTEVIRRFRTGLAIGEQLTRQVGILEHLFGISAMAAPQVELVNALNELDIPMDVCETLLAELERFPWSRTTSTARCIEGEVMVHRDMIQWVYTDNGHGDGILQMDRLDILFDTKILTPPSQSVPVFSNLRSFLFQPSRREMLAMIEVWRQTMLDMIDNPQRDFFQDIDDYYDSFSSNLVLRRFMPPTIALFIRNNAFFESHLAGTHVMLRLEMYHERTESWPAKLTDAMSDAEARDPVSGEMFVYERTPDDEAGRAYELRVPWGEPDQPSAIINPPREPLEEDLLSDESDEE